MPSENKAVWWILLVFDLFCWGALCCSACDLMSSHYEPFKSWQMSWRVEWSLLIGSGRPIPTSIIPRHEMRQWAKNKRAFQNREQSKVISTTGGLNKPGRRETMLCDLLWTGEMFSLLTFVKIFLAQNNKLRAQKVTGATRNTLKMPTNLWLYHTFWANKLVKRF